MTSEVIINVVLLQLGRVMMVVTHLNPKWGAFQIPTLLSKDLALKALCLVSSFSFLVSYLDFVPVSFFCVPVSWIPLSSPALLGFFEQASIMAEFSCYYQSCDSNSVHKLLCGIDLHPLLGADESQ